MTCRTKARPCRLRPPYPSPRVPQNFLDTRASQQRGRCRLLRRGASAPPHLREPPQPPGGARLTPGRLRDEEAPPALGTYRCRSCRKRPAGGWGRKCKPPPPGPAGSSCRGTRRGSSATPSCCPRGASSLLRSRRAAAVPFAGLFYSRFLTARAPPLPACLPASSHCPSLCLSRWPRQRSLRRYKPEGTAGPRLPAAGDAERCGAERCGAVRSCAAPRRAGARSYSLDRALSGSGGAASPDQWEPRITSSAGEASGPGAGPRLQRLIRNSAGSAGRAVGQVAGRSEEKSPSLSPTSLSRRRGRVETLKN